MKKVTNRDIANTLYLKMIHHKHSREWFIRELCSLLYISRANAGVYFYNAKKHYEATARARAEENAKAQARREKAQRDYEAFARQQQNYRSYYDDQKFKEALKQAFSPKGIPSDVCAILNIAATATRDEVNAAWKKLALANHPDRGGSLVEMQEINAARDRALKCI